MATTVEERLARLEGGYEHVATKADIAELRSEIARMETRLLLRLGGLMVAVAAAVTAAVRFLA
ncbi:MAG: hypothetical protein F4W95_06655 [Chloroflexi bacterium]|nr:hypothetical protein [Chloroflexota bacterium]MYD48150.1 hypothetical protein [Chloroflexota bacterium]